MNIRPLGVIVPLVLLGLMVTPDIGRAQSEFYKPYGATRSDAAPSAGAGYSYVAPSYQLGLTQSTYRGYADYHGLPRTPAYRHTTRMPYFSHIQPYYQTSTYLPFPRYAVPPLGAQSSVAFPVRPSLGYAQNPGAYTAYRSGPTYHPYTTVSQFVYTPSYSPAVAVPYPACYGAYGYSAFYGY